MTILTNTIIPVSIQKTERVTYWYITPYAMSLHSEESARDLLERDLPEGCWVERKTDINTNLTERLNPVHTVQGEGTTNG